MTYDKESDEYRLKIESLKRSQEDPLFLNDINETEEDFKHSDSDLNNES